MTTRPKLVLMHPAEYDNGFYPSLLPSGLLEIEFYDSNKTYDLDAVFLYDWFVSPHRPCFETELHAGRRIIIDYKTEHFFWIENKKYLDALTQYPAQHLFLISANGASAVNGLNVSAVPNYFWWELQKEYKHNGYNSYQPAPTHQKKFFCQIRLIKAWRDVLVEKIAPLLDQGLYSYVERNIFLPGDMPSDIHERQHGFQRYVNTEWYNQTDFTLTVESSALPADSDPHYVQLIKDHGVFLSEKSYKPLGMLHPFMIAGQPGILNCVKQSGFETFPELWDESYDDEHDFLKRIDHIIKNIEQFDHRMLDNSIVQDKLKFNRNRFFDQNIVNEKMQQQIIDPVLKFIGLQ